MTQLTPEEIRRGLVENRNSPYGAARNAHAETLSAAAEATGDRQLFRQSLDVLIEAYEYSAERARMVVPFARLLQEYDRDPGAFDAGQTHSLHWQFKWVAGLIVSSPDIPVETATRWLDDMERRYRLAGFGERAVRQAEFHLADATGDHARAERAITAWAAAPRDRMSDCHACEINTQGQFWVDQKQDEKAVEVWTPVLDGHDTCMEEPERTLAHALLPLLRLGRHDEARSCHLRGYRMARGNESLLRSIAEHIEFCALTGNESRGLEILAEHTAHLDRLAAPAARLGFAGGVLVLLRRLADLGHGDRPVVAHQGAMRTVDELYVLLHAEASEIAARFDVRNSNTHVSDEFRTRITREPLVDDLPLGVRVVPLAPTAAARVTPAAQNRPAAPAAPAEPFAELVERARAARRSGHPSVNALWKQVVARAEAGENLPGDTALPGDLLERRALTAARTGDPGAAALMMRATEVHTSAGEASRAAFTSLAVAGIATTRGAAPEEIRALLAEAERLAGSLDPAEPLRERRIAAAELHRIRIEAHLRPHAPDEAAAGPDADPAAGPDAELVAGLEEYVARYGRAGGGAPHDVADLVGEAETALARIAIRAGELERALALLASAAARQVGAGRPWDAVQPLSLQADVLAHLGEQDQAEAVARTALAHAAELTDAEELAAVRLTLADVLLRAEGRAEEAAGHALEAVHRLDRAGLGATDGARARQLLARAYAEADRIPEAVEVLHSALPDLLEEGEHEGVEARSTLARLLRGTGDFRGAAEQYLLAAETAKGWENQHAQAHFAQSAADALSSAGLDEEATAAYERAVELWDRLGDNPVGQVRCLRSLAWLGLNGTVDDAAAEGARALMEQALAVLDTAERPDHPQLRYERGQTWQQTAEVLRQRVEAADPLYGEDEPPAPLADGRRTELGDEAVLLWERAAAEYAVLGPDALDDRFRCLTAAGWLDHGRGRGEAGAARLAAFAEEFAEVPGEEAERLVRDAEQVRAALLR
ncbi:tetratricopeptide repeat protein [Streptomyces sp. NPDC086023]|uniref:tetratricopeptide repeat protein n=1 Tax=Streptomyces sp. NPDC086023 TaxID=3365746 RepID=UPI0037CF8258